MAGDWIAWTKGLTRKREVLLIAKSLQLDPRIVAAVCMVVWEWADAETADGTMFGLTTSAIDAVAGVSGFGEAMKQTGWLVETPDGLDFPNWERWNSQSAKRRLKENRRKEGWKKGAIGAQ